MSDLQAGRIGTGFLEVIDLKAGYEFRMEEERIWIFIHTGTKKCPCYDLFTAVETVIVKKEFRTGAATEI